jgi:hypothetical protein
MKFQFNRKNYVALGPNTGSKQMSGFGYKQTFRGPNLKSALPPTPDIPQPTQDFRF